MLHSLHCMLQYRNYTTYKCIWVRAMFVWNSFLMRACPCGTYNIMEWMFPHWARFWVQYSLFKYCRNWWHAYGNSIIIKCIWSHCQHRTIHLQFCFYSVIKITSLESTSTRNSTLISDMVLFWSGWNLKPTGYMLTLKIFCSIKTFSFSNF